MTKQRVAAALQASGAGSAVLAAWTVSETAALVVLAVALILFGLAIERDA